MFSRNGIGRGFDIPPVTKNIIIINVLVWLVEFIARGFGTRLVDLLGLHLVGAGFNPIQVVTYLFLHDPTSPLHVFFNMFTLWMFGRTLEMVWGSGRFLLFYFVCGIGAAAVQEVVWALTWESDYIAAIARQNGLTASSMSEYVHQALASGDASVMSAMADYKRHILTIGASGAIFGLLLGFAFVFPDLPLYLFFIPVPIKAKYMVVGYGVLEFFLGVTGAQGTVAHFAHLGGMLFGLILLLYWKKKGLLRGNGFY